MQPLGYRLRAGLVRNDPEAENFWYRKASFSPAFTCLTVCVYLYQSFLTSFPSSVSLSTIGAMVHYIRFLRTPQTAINSKTVDVSAVIAVTTDLGDALYSQDLDLNIAVVEANRPHGVLHTETAKWQAHSRALKLTISCPGKYRSRPVRLHVTTDETLSTLKSLDVPRILDVWSVTFPLSEKQRTEPIVERRLFLPNKSHVRMWEETGDSIARHVWYVSCKCPMIWLTTMHQGCWFRFLALLRSSALITSVPRCVHFRCSPQIQ